MHDAAEGKKGDGQLHTSMEQHLKLLDAHGELKARVSQLKQKCFAMEEEPSELRQKSQDTSQDKAKAQTPGKVVRLKDYHAEGEFPAKRQERCNVYKR
eukprot:767895-Hanusia_phi.AAC.8